MQPVIILGAGRSGTKFLRDTLAASRLVCRVPFDVGYVWRTGNENCTHDEFTAPMAARAPKAWILRTLEKMARSQASGDETIMLEKSVPNALRPAFVREIIPNAKFVHLLRDGRAVSESALRMWQGPRDTGYLMQKLRYFPVTNYRYALWYAGDLVKSRFSREKAPPVWGPRYDGLSDDMAHLAPITVCARQWRRCVERTREQLGAFDPAQVFEIRYEDLVGDPHALGALCDFVGITDAAMVRQSFIGGLRTGTVEAWRDRLDGEQIALVNQEIGATLKEVGYE